ncbi:uncharacterized protein B0H18DRAFT_1045148, partial [Fomitopsis serialis]|uniref:uncharacterized protein n=1 Tax=Fomitopsis serialis TaxID=139415 RepID=UPI002007720F
MFRSERFQWLPSEFHVEEDGTVRLALTDIIPKVMEKAVLMYERVLSDLARETQVPTRLDLQGHKFPQCVWPDEYEPGPDEETYSGYMTEHTRLQAEDRKRWEADEEKFYEDSRKAFLDTHSSVDGWRAPPYPDYQEVDHYGRFEQEYLDAAADTNCELTGKTLQVIVKLANIVLTPEKPVYGGGTWHVEGKSRHRTIQLHIIDSFRNAVNEPRYHEQNDIYCMRHLYGIIHFEQCVQVVGQVTTKQDRCIAFPNLYQHLVSPFRLIDPTKPGHRKILVFFLVDPNITIPSATTVGPQQEAWIRRAAESKDLWRRLPVELHEMIWERLDPMTEEQAKKYREELMKERTLNVQTVEEQRFGRSFNL